MATYAKLKSGDWGLKGTNLVEGTSVAVTKRTGETKTERIGKVLFRAPDGTCFATIASSGSSRPSSGRGGGARGRRTGCSCGSREDAHGELIPSPNNCRSCEFDAYDM